MADALEIHGNILNELGRTTEAQESFRESARLKGGEAGNGMNQEWPAMPKCTWISKGQSFRRL